MIIAGAEQGVDAAARGGDPLRVLLIDDDDADAERFTRTLLDAARNEFVITRVSALVQGLRAAARGAADVVVLDLSLPDSAGHDTFAEARARIADLPIVVLIREDQQERAPAFVARGAQDCLVKETMTSSELRRSLTYAAQRHPIRAALQAEVRRQQYTVEALSDSEARFRSIAESAVDAVVVADDQARIVAWNRAAEVMFGHSDSDVFARPLGSFLCSPQAPDAAELDLHRSIPVGSVVEAFGVRSDGSRFPIELSMATWEASQGRFYGAIIRDVTERKRSEAASALQLQRLTGVVQAQHDITAAGLDFDDVVAVALHHLMGLVGADGAAIVVRHDDMLSYRGGVGVLATATTQITVRPPARRAVVTGEPVLLADRRDAGGDAAAAMIAVPLRSGGRIAGALEVVGASPRRFDDADVATTTLLAGFIGAAMDQVDAFAARTNLLAERTVALETLAESEQRFRQVFRDAPSGILLASLRPGEEGKVLKVNDAMCAIVGFSAAEIGRMGAAALIHPEDRDGLEGVRLGGDVAGRALTQRLVAVDGAVRYIEGSVTVISDTAGVPLYSITQVEDVTARKEAEVSLRRLALHDTLTGLANRTLAADRLDHALRRARRRGTRVGVLFLDLDHFKTVNDRNGHHFGDQVLIGVGQRLQTLLRPNDTAARLGGDEFVLVCEDLADADEAVAVAERVDAVMSEPLIIEDVKVGVTASIGICVATGTETVEELLRRADSAMYSAKHRGRAGHVLFSGDVPNLALRGATLQAELARGLEAGELAVVYQPVYDVLVNDVVGVEALVRWHHPEHGVLLPAAFLDVAEESALIMPLGRLVRAEACRQVAAWQGLRRDGEPLAVWVNVSGREAADSAFGPTVEALLDGCGLDPTLLRIDLSERVLVEASDTTLQRLRVLQERGVRLGLDDFGRGDTSVWHLSTLPISYVKVDRSFVQEARAGAAGAAFTNALAGLGQSLHLDLVAEGVESPRDLDWIGAMGYRLAQGHYLGRPCTPLELEELVRRSDVAEVV